MLSVGLEGLQALSEGASAFAETEQNTLLGVWREDVVTQREISIQWRKQDLHYRALEKQWRVVECKRNFADDKSKSLSLLAELGALMGGFQMMMFYELELPPVDEYWFSDALLCLWGCSCVSVACCNLLVMAVSSMINFGILEVSLKEGSIEGTPQELLYDIHDGSSEGVVMTVAHILHLWEVRYDDLFRILVLTFSYAIPWFFINLSITCLAKWYHISLVAAWLGFCIPWYIFRTVVVSLVSSFLQVVRDSQR